MEREKASTIKERAEEEERESPWEELEEKLESREFWTIFALAAVAGALVEYLTGRAGPLLPLLSTILAFKAVLELRERRLGVDALMSIVGYVTFFLGARVEGFVIYVLYGIAETLEEVAEAWAKRSLRELLQVVPKRVLRLRGESVEEVDVEELRVGDFIRVRPGERVPADSLVLDGRGVVDLSIVTGESEPVEVRRGEVVPSGALVLESPLTLRVDKDPRDSTAQLIIKQVRESLERKGRVENFLSRISAPYTVVVLGVFAASALLLDPYRSLSIILAGCPSAFVITSSVSTILGVARMARRGVIVKGGPPLDVASRVGVVILDKTGTVTLGEPRVTQFIALNGDEQALKSLAKALALHSLHPLSRAIAHMDGDGGNGVSGLPELREVREIPGKGIIAKTNGERVLLGSRSFLAEQGVEVPSSVPPEATVLLAVGDRLVGAFVVEDVPREDAREAIEALRARGLRVMLVSGDKREKVEKVARSLGIEEYLAEVRPEDKRRVVKELQSKGIKVAMVGDGINDAPALAEADLGVAMGRYALVAEVADAVIVSGELSRLADLLETGGLRERVLKLGIGSAAALKLGVMALGLAGVLPIWLIAALGDDGSTLLGLLPVSLLAKK